MSNAFPKEETRVSRFMEMLQIHSEEDYENRLEYVAHLMNRVNAGDDLVIPLLEYVSKLVEAYEDERYPVELSTPARMLAFYMEQHGHKQKDLTGIAAQSVISEILSGKRVPTVAQVKRLAEKYRADPGVFI